MYSVYRERVNWSLVENAGHADTLVTHNIFICSRNIHTVAGVGTATTVGFSF